MSIAQLEPLVADCSPCALQPVALVVSWHGVLALAMEGWPLAMTALKDDLNEHAAEQWALRDENSGSRWPKITLACLRDGQQLTLVQLRSLHALAQSFADRIAADPWRLEVRTLSAVVFSCRSLERLLSRQDMPMRALDSLEVKCSAESMQRVAAVRAELSDHTAEAYLPLVNADGGRLAHYTQPHTEATLVAFGTQTCRFGSAFVSPRISDGGGSTAAWLLSFLPLALSALHHSRTHATELMYCSQRALDLIQRGMTLCVGDVVSRLAMARDGSGDVKEEGRRMDSCSSSGDSMRFASFCSRSIPRTFAPSDVQPTGAPRPSTSLSRCWHILRHEAQQSCRPP